jgi:hypothetical protein
MYRKAPAGGDLNPLMQALARASESEVIEIWPENWPSVCMFTLLATQWRVGVSGATGLDYSALYPLLDKATTSLEAWQELFDDIRHMERVALEAMRDER